MRRRNHAYLRFWTLGIIFIATACTTRASDPELRGTVKDENETPVAGASVTVRPAPAASRQTWQAETDATGAFSIALPSAGDYLVGVERPGYYELQDRPIHVDTVLELNLSINKVREVFQSVDVNAQPSPVDIAQTQHEEHLTGTEINDILYPNSHSLRNSMKLMPGVVEDSGGGMHFDGSSENQVQYVLNGFDIASPISAQFNTTLAVEGIRSMDYSSGRYSPEYGKGSAGVLNINTDNGTDVFHYTATDFIPGLQFQQGLRIGNWYPRAGISGPIVRGRAWFSDTFDSEYNTSLITGLPKGQNTRSGWAGSNLLHTQFNLTPHNLLFADFLVNVDRADRVGLGALDPVSTTQTVHTGEYFGSLKDQVYLGARAIIEFGYARSEFSASNVPQGQNLYVFSPQGRSGNYFIHSTQGATRDEGRVHGYAPQFQLWGSHQIEAGATVDVLHYNADFRRTGYQLVGLSGQILSQTSFSGSGIFGVDGRETAAWVRDNWRLSKQVQLDAGLREDWNQFVHNSGWSPRVAVSWAPFASGRTRVAGGYAVTHDAVPLQPFGQVFDQTASTTVYQPNGLPAGPPVPTTFLPPANLRLPRATNWTLSVDRELSPHVFASASYLRRRGTDGFDFLNTLALQGPPSTLPLPNGSLPGAYKLANQRRDDFDSLQFKVRQTFSGQYEWMASYTFSRAKSDAILDPNTLVPLQVVSYLAPMPWDSPNRFLGWAYAPLPWKNWAVAALVDARSGFPFSIADQTGAISGAVDSRRYSFNFDLNLAIERTITLHGYRFALRGGVNNLTNQNNATAVNNVIGSPQYLHFFGYEGRHFVVRIRFFGRAKK